jgi:alpha-beta hydrolase superfamily lysophospholipase
MQTREQKTLNLSSCPGYREELISSAGTRIALSIYPKEQNAPCIVFVPGTMTHPLFYDDFLTTLSEQGFNVVGIHLLSHGKSPRERKTYSIEDMIQNIKDTVSFCIDNFNRQIILMGSSQGGMMSLASAAEDHRIKAVFAHNAVLPILKESISITIFPGFLKYFQKIFISILKFGAWFFPALPIPLWAYLQINRISESPEIQSQYLNDPIGLTSYPLSFMTSMFSAELSGVMDGAIKCPVVVIASTGDKLFSIDYIKQVYSMIKAPEKDMMVFEENCHLIFNECVDQVMGPVVEKIKAYL